MKLNKLVVAVVALFAINSAASAQNAEYRKGDILVNALYSIGSFESYGNGIDGFAQHAIGLTGEYGILDDMIHGKGAIGVGAELGFGFGSKDYDGAEVKGRRLHIATRGTMHYCFIPALDTYAGFRVGIADWTKYKVETKVPGMGTLKAESDNDGEFIYNFIAGARYMLSDNFGLNVETAFWGRYSHLSLGVSFKF
ncbi:MAG: outer membrane beta-barrel protein [Bacteroidia bacterium]|nr:outer membrane beta-barrel protein [Bacteroidia bacterium]